MEKLNKLTKIFKKIYYKTFIENFKGKLKYDFPSNFYRWDLIEYLIKKNNYTNYLEIGCDQNQLFSKVLIENKIGVDPQYFFSKRQKSTNDYFKGGGRVPWWAAGLSIFGTALSAITFMAIPAKAYSADWSYIWLNAGILLVAPLIIYFLIPIYRKLNITSAYHYLELRFNVILRLIGSVSFILFQIGRMAVILFLPALAINVVTGINIYTCVLSMGLLSLLYTLMGGIEAVIWTDALQVIVLI